MELKRMARLARAGDRVLTWFAGFLVLLMLLYGGYSLWDTNNVMNGGFISDELLRYKPTGANGCARLQELMAKIPTWSDGSPSMAPTSTIPLFREKITRNTSTKTCWESPRFRERCFWIRATVAR